MILTFSLVHVIIAYQMEGPMKVSEVSVFIPPKKKKSKPKAPKKPKSLGSISNGTILYLFSDSDTMKYKVGDYIWQIEVSGKLIVSKDEHTFICSWAPDGSIYATLYPNMTEYETILKKILSLKIVRDWLEVNSKRKVQDITLE